MVDYLASPLPHLSRCTDFETPCLQMAKEQQSALVETLAEAMEASGQMETVQARPKARVPIVALKVRLMLVERAWVLLADAYVGMALVIELKEPPAWLP